MLIEISGTFVRICFADQVDVALKHPSPTRPVARFNRLGESALYLSPDETAARVAIGEYIKVDDPPRVLVTYDVAPCHVLDLRHPDAQRIYEQARQPWQSALKRGEDPSSWAAADLIRARADVAGLFDPSRRRPGLWHITLFRWNEPGAPRIDRRSVSGPLVIPVGYR
jgi:RES domain-containing protein